MRTPPSITAIATGAVALALLSGCGDGGPGPSDDTTVSYRDSPLIPYMNALGGFQDESAADAQAARSEAVIAACMQDQGFEYTPQDTSGGNRSLEGGDGDMPAWDSLEFAQQYGYGATTWGDLPVNKDDEHVDANADYVAGMSESEQAAYYEALYGPQMMSEEPLDEADPPEYDPSTAGCQGKARSEVHGGTDLSNDPEFKDLADEMATLSTDSLTDERMVEALTEWAECMAGEGYDFANPQEAQQSIFDLMAEVPYDEETGIQDEAALAEITEEELATATADRVCQNTTSAGRAALEAQFAIEQEFIDAHKERLDAMLEKAAQAPE
jgi:hypothetical protein